MNHETQPHNPDTEPYMAPDIDYDAESAKAGWDSPERAQELVGEFIHEGSNVLDIGIGTGQAVKGYKEKGARIIGIDRDEGMLQAAQETAGDAGVMRLGNINEQLPIEDLEGQADAVQIIGALEFAENIEDVFDQVEPTLNEGGVFVFTVETPEDDEMNKRSEYFPGADVTVYRHSPEEIHELLSDKGLTLLHEETYGGYDRGDMNGAKVPYRIFLAQKTFRHFSERTQDNTEQDPSLVEASESRTQAHLQVYSDLKNRIAENPEPTEEELDMGAYVEEIEPQARDAIIELRRKGYQTQSSGFYGHEDELQNVDGPMHLDNETAESLIKQGYEVAVDQEGYTMIVFQPNSYDVDELKAQWYALASSLPDKGHQAGPGNNIASVEFRQELSKNPERFMQQWVYEHINRSSSSELIEAVRNDGYDIDLDYVWNTRSNR